MGLGQLQIAQQGCGTRGAARTAVAARVATGRQCSTSQPARSQQKCSKSSVSPQATAAAVEGPPLELDKHGLQRLVLKPEGWSSWKWRNYRVNYTSAGSSGPPILLVHGFGASVYHWRYNIPELAKNHRVFALDMLGFGWSEKPVMEYQGCHIWSEQIRDFIKEVIGGDKVTLVGNSLGGYTSLLTAVKFPEVVKAVVLLNAAGRFEEVKATIEAPVEAAIQGLPVPGVQDEVQQAAGVKLTDASQAEAVTPAGRSNAAQPAASSSAAEASEADKPLYQRAFEPLQRIAMKAGVYVAFLATKQPARIRQVLRQVYVDHTNIDDELVRSIALPANDPNAAKIFYRVITGWGGAGTPVNELLSKLQQPLLLLWGVKDPWIGSGSADRIQRYYPKADRYEMQAGHCPQDDMPAEFNQALIKWVDGLAA